MRPWFHWVFWSLALATCPVAMVVIGIVYERTGPPPYDEVTPLATHVVGVLWFVHLIVSIVASLSAFLLVRRNRVWMVWGVIVMIGILTGMAALGASMATTGIYL